MGKVPDHIFRPQLKQSHEIVILVTQWLRDNGYDAQVNTMRVTPDHQSRHNYTDDGDITVGGNARIEVKYWPDIAFRGRDSCPYPWVFVDEVYQIEREHTLPLLGYVIVNGPKTHVAMISENTKIHWEKRKALDKRYNEEREWYACPRKYVLFRSMRKTCVS